MVDPAMQREAREVAARLSAVETAYADAERDLAVVLTQPGLFDPSVPAVARFREGSSRARRLVAEEPLSWIAQQGVSDLESCWVSLRAEARRTGLSGFSWRQRRRIRRARQLLERARSDRGSPWMRVAWYFRGLQLLDGLIDLPEQLRREIHEAALHVERLQSPVPDFPTYW